MAVEAPIDGNGTIVSITFDGSGAVVLGFVTSVDGPEITRGEVDTTHLATVGDMTNRPSRLKDNGEVSLEGWYDYSDAGQSLIADLVEDKDAIPTWKITYEDGSYEQFTGWVKSHKPAGSVENDANVGYSTVVRLTSAITYGIPV